MENQKNSRREVKRIKLLTTERPSHSESKEFKKIRKFKKSNKIKDVREKNWHIKYQDNEDNDELAKFQKIKKSRDKYMEVNTPGDNLSTRKIFSRTDPGLGKRKEKGIAANVDQIIIVASIKNPPLKSGLIDRFLLVAEKNEFPVIICLNKIDLAENEDEYVEEMKLYSELGYKLIPTSVKENIGIDELRQNLEGKRSLFTGHSGVGKSSLINSLDTGLKLRVGDVSESTNKGCHTTTSTRLIKMSFGGEVFDSPGIKQFGLVDLDKKEISLFFPEFRDIVHLCEFPDCSHIHEKNCAVKGGVNAGNISQKRYGSYIRIWNSL